MFVIGVHIIRSELLDVEKILLWMIVKFFIAKLENELLKKDHLLVYIICIVFKSWKKGSRWGFFFHLLKGGRTCKVLIMYRKNYFMVNGITIKKRMKKEKKSLCYWSI